MNSLSTYYKLTTAQFLKFTVAICLFVATLFVVLQSKNIVVDYVHYFSKQKGNIKSDEFINWTDDELLKSYDSVSNGAFRQKLQKELKARNLRNKQKDRGKKQ